MSLIYRGHLEQDPPHAAASFAMTRQRLEPLVHAARYDLQLAFDRLGALDRAAALLPPGFDGFWLEVSARGDSGALDRYRAWMKALHGGYVQLRCLEYGAENELTVRLPGPRLHAVDDEALNPRRAGVIGQRPWLDYNELGARMGAAGGRVRSAGGRVRTAYRLLSTLMGSTLPTFEQWAATHAPEPPFDAEVLRELSDYEPRAPWSRAATALADPPAPSQVDVRTHGHAHCPLNLQIEVNGPGATFRTALLGAWIGLLETIDRVEVRCMGTLGEIKRLAQQLELVEREGGALNVFGISTLHLKSRPPPEALATLLHDPELDGSLVDWGLRASDLRWKLDPDLAPPDHPSSSFYFVRSDRRRAFDGVQICLDVDDIEDPRFARAQRELADMLEPALAEVGVWQLDGALAGSPEGQRYARLTAALRAAKAELQADLPPAPVTTPRQGSAVVRWVHTLLGRNEDFDLPELLERAVTRSLPGFQQDKTAHATEAYFLDFYRPVGYGYQYLQFERTHAVVGHRVRVGVSRYRASVADLDPAPGLVLPGLAFPLADLVPEQKDLVWTYSTAREAESALAETMNLLIARAVPFFERAEQILSDASGDATPPEQRVRRVSGALHG